MIKREGKLTVGGVYKIENTRNHRAYIGSSTNISSRISQHESSLKAGKHGNMNLQHDYDNGDDFICTVVEEILIKDRRQLLSEEARITNYLKKNKIALYNIIEAQNQFLSDRSVAERLANLYCKEKFGIPLGVFMQKVPAERDLIVRILEHPELEQKIIDEYKDVIDYQKEVKSRRHSMSYKFARASRSKKAADTKNGVSQKDREKPEK